MNEELRKLVQAENPTFEGAKRRYVFPEQARTACERAAVKWAAKTGKNHHAALTDACLVYWELFDERKR